jgi:small subunit ribosomal protein S7
MEKILLFNRWDTSQVKIKDPGLRNQINLVPIIVPRTDGKYTTRQKDKRKMNVTERLMNKMMVPGHRGKKHKITSGHFPGNTVTIYNSLKQAFDTIEKRTKKNPVQVLVEAIENSALLEEIAAYRLGGIIARNAVVVSPQRRLDISLRHISQGIYKASFKGKAGLPNVIADELVAASNNDSKSFAIQERNRIEKEAEGAR